MSGLFKKRIQRIFESLGSLTGAISGVQKLEALKLKVNQVYSRLSDAKQTFSESRAKYYIAVEHLKTSQSLINNFLQRKSLWSEHDLELYTKAVSDEHLCGQKEREAKQILEELEKLVSGLQDEYDSVVRERYQEELLVAERNRGMSNILTWSLMIANLSIFSLSQFIVEPYRREVAKNTVRIEVENAVNNIQVEMSSLAGTLATLSDRINNSLENSEKMMNRSNDIVKISSKRSMDKLKDKQSSSTQPIQSSAQKISNSDGIEPLILFFGIMIVTTLLKRN